MCGSLAIPALRHDVHYLCREFSHQESSQKILKDKKNNEYAIREISYGICNAPRVT